MDMLTTNHPLGDFETFFFFVYIVLAVGGLINFIGLHKINKKLYFWGFGILLSTLLMTAFYMFLMGNTFGYVFACIAVFFFLVILWRFIKEDLLFKGQYWYNEKLIVKFAKNSSFKWRKQIVHLDVDRLCRVEYREMKEGRPFYTIVILNIMGKPRFCDVPEEYLRRP